MTWKPLWQKINWPCQCHQCRVVSFQPPPTGAQRLRRRHGFSWSVPDYMQANQTQPFFVVLLFCSYVMLYIYIYMSMGSCISDVFGVRSWNVLCVCWFFGGSFFNKMNRSGASGRFVLAFKLKACAYRRIVFVQRQRCQKWQFHLRVRNYWLLEATCAMWVRNYYWLLEATCAMFLYNVNHVESVSKRVFEFRWGRESES